uniref:Epoxide hydrolase n=1 Tax=Plectus sambesii TaxID=2011161 RepID=A0A914X0J5_9BILA
MGKVFTLLVIVSVAIVAVFIGKHLGQPDEVLQVPEREWFGTGEERKEDTKIEPFTIAVPEESLKDLRRRLEQTRFFEPLEDAKNFQYGFNTIYLREVHKYWLTSYDWRRQEATLNSFKHFKTEIEGVKVHFIHAKPPAGKYKRVLPLLLVHGWPGSVYEFYKILPLLTDPLGNKFKPFGTTDVDFAFEVIAPSIPGYGWSEAPKKTGFGPIAAGRFFSKLMVRLGFKQFYCQGGDWGAIITTATAIIHPERVLGLHLNMFMASPTSHPAIIAKMVIGAFLPSLVYDAGEAPKMGFGATFMNLIKESGYFHIQATKPDTVGFSLNDSPLGLAAYILEKFSTWTHPAYKELPDGGLTRQYTLDELLTNVMIYWT